MTTAWTLTVTDLKQYIYCPRIMYYMRCLPDIRPVTTKMEEGILAHEVAEVREQRRQLKQYGFATGERHYDVALYSTTLRLTAVVDMVIIHPDGKSVAVPVDYKLSALAGEHFRTQLGCYALMVEEEFGLPVPYGFIYLTEERRVEKVMFSAASRVTVRELLTEMRSVIEQEAMPEPTTRSARCINCEFRRFCNDVQ